MIEYHSAVHMTPSDRSSHSPSNSPLDRLMEVSADATAATVNGLQELSARRRNFSLRRSAGNAASRGARAIVTRVMPARTSDERRLGAPMDMLHFLIAGGVPATSTLARAVFFGTVRAAPVVWRVSRDPRARGAAALLVRIVFGHRRRPRR
jgi:hypothetical protein